MFNLLLWWMLTVDNCIHTKPMTPTSTTWSNQNIIDWPVMLCTLQEQKEVLWTTPTTWLHAWPGMVRRPITSIAKGEEWCGEATGLRTSKVAGETKQEWWPASATPESRRIHLFIVFHCLVTKLDQTLLSFGSILFNVLELKSLDDIFWWYLDVSYVSLCQNSE